MGWVEILCQVLLRSHGCIESSLSEISPSIEIRRNDLFRASLIGMSVGINLPRYRVML